jgi:uncharacterized cupin superfamily protein
MGWGAMVGEAVLEDVGSGVAPASPGWFVVNVRDAAWIRNEAFGARCVFESDRRVLRDNPNRVDQRFGQVGITLAVLEPGRPSGLYHAESAEESFLVLQGECSLLIEDEERPLRQWDFVHCPRGTAHAFVGAGGAHRCVLLMVGARPEQKTIVYPRCSLALRHNAGVQDETDSPAEAYARLPHWQPGRPQPQGELPWNR